MDSQQFPQNPQSIGEIPLQQPSTDNNAGNTTLHSNRFSALKVLGALFVLIIIGGGGYYLGQNAKLNLPTGGKISKPQLKTQNLSLSPTPTLDPTANWKTLILGMISFKYPSNWTDPSYTKTGFGQSAEIKNQDSAQRIVILSGINKGLTEQKLSEFIDSLVVRGAERLTLDGNEGVKTTNISQKTTMITVYVNSKNEQSMYSISLEIPSSYPVQERGSLLNQILSTFKFTFALPPCPTLQPKSITFLLPGTPTPTIVENLPNQIPCGPFTNPGESGFTPDGKLTPDLQRIIDLQTLKVSLETYKAAKGTYPATLNSLFPDYAPVGGEQKLTQPPTDPINNQAYQYVVSPERLQYAITAVLSNGQKYSIFNSNSTQTVP